jgi:hypothetical protein
MKWNERVHTERDRLTGRTLVFRWHKDGEGRMVRDVLGDYASPREAQAMAKLIERGEV